MALPMHDLPDDDSIPPELLVDEAPIADAQFDLFMERAFALADDAGIDVAGAVDVLTGRTEDNTFEPAEGDLPGQVAEFVLGDIDPDKADWAMAKVRDARKAQAEGKARAAVLHARIDRWFEDIDRRAEAEAAFFEPLLVAYARQRFEADPKLKTTSLVSGAVTSSGPTKGNEWEVIVPEGPTKEVTDQLEAEVIAWATTELEGDELDAVVKVVSSVRISELRKLVKVVEGESGRQVVLDATGEPVPVLKARRKERTFKVKPDL